MIDGMPKPLADATEEIEAWQWWLVLHRPALEQADSGLKLIIDQKDRLSQHIADVSTRMGAVWLSCNLIADILKRSVDDDLLIRFQKIEEDISVRTGSMRQGSSFIGCRLRFSRHCFVFLYRL